MDCSAAPQVASSAACAALLLFPVLRSSATPAGSAAVGALRRPTGAGGADGHTHGLWRPDGGEEHLQALEVGAVGGDVPRFVWLHFISTFHLGGYVAGMSA